MRIERECERAQERGGVDYGRVSTIYADSEEDDDDDRVERAESWEKEVLEKMSTRSAREWEDDEEENVRERSGE